jgi:hypothetical protein
MVLLPLTKFTVGGNPFTPYSVKRLLQLNTIDECLANYDNWPWDFFAAMEILLPNYIGADSVATELDYHNLDWLDPRPKPSWESLVAAWNFHKGKLRAALLLEKSKLRNNSGTVKFQGRTYLTDDISYSAMLGIMLSPKHESVDINWLNVEDGYVKIPWAEFKCLFTQITHFRNAVFSAQE